MSGTLQAVMLLHIGVVAGNEGIGTADAQRRRPKDISLCNGEDTLLKLAFAENTSFLVDVQTLVDWDSSTSS